MNCRQAEKLLLKSLDGLLDKPKAEILEKHLKICPECSRIRKEYETIVGTLKMTACPEPKPYFWERLQPKLKRIRVVNPWAQWKLWGFRAVPVALITVVILAGALAVIDLRKPEKLSSSEAFLLQNQNPLEESSSILDEEKVEDKNMRLIFASREESQAPRKNFHDK